MATIKRIAAIITSVTDLTPTARAVTLSLAEPLSFSAGSFVNLFMTHEGVVHRRAFSISSSEKEKSTIDLSIRLSPDGKVSPLFWRENIVGTKVEVMGPLGLNTADKMLGSNIYLFGFGVGAGVVKSLADHFMTEPCVTKLTIMTGSRNENDIIHFDYFQEAVQNKKVTVQYVISNPTEENIYPVGYIQNHLAGLDFNNSDVYVCGQEVACQALVETIKNSNPQNCNFFIEGFH